MSAARVLQELGPLPKLGAEELESRLAVARSRTPPRSARSTRRPTEHRGPRRCGSQRLWPTRCPTSTTIASSSRPSRCARPSRAAHADRRLPEGRAGSLGRPRDRRASLRPGPGADEGLRADRDRQKGQQGHPRGAPVPRGSGRDDQDASGRGRPERLGDRRAGRGHRGRGQAGRGLGRRRDQERAQVDRGGVRRGGQLHGAQMANLAKALLAAGETISTSSRARSRLLSRTHWRS